MYFKLVILAIAYSWSSYLPHKSGNLSEDFPSSQMPFKQSLFFSRTCRVLYMKHKFVPFIIAGGKRNILQLFNPTIDHLP